MEGVEEEEEAEVAEQEVSKSVLLGGKKVVAFRTGFFDTFMIVIVVGHYQ